MGQMDFTPIDDPWTVLVSVLSASRFRLVVFPQPAFKVFGMTDVKSALRILQDVNVEIHVVVSCRDWLRR